MSVSLWSTNTQHTMYATISADIVSSTSLTSKETIRLKQNTKGLFSLLEERYPKFWGRQIKGDYIECLIPNVADAFRIALILKTFIKSFEVSTGRHTKDFRTYGLRMAIGIGDMRIVNKTQNILDGEAIYLSGRAIENMGALYKGTFSIEIEDEKLQAQLQTIAILTDALMNNMTRRQCEVLYHKLLSTKEFDIAKILGIQQSSVNGHATSANWYGIEAAVNYFEQINFAHHEP